MGRTLSWAARIWAVAFRPLPRPAVGRVGRCRGAGHRWASGHSCPCSPGRSSRRPAGRAGTWRPGCSSRSGSPGWATWCRRSSRRCGVPGHGRVLPGGAGVVRRGVRSGRSALGAAPRPVAPAALRRRARRHGRGVRRRRRYLLVPVAVYGGCLTAMAVLSTGVGRLRGHRRCGLPGLRRTDRARRVRPVVRSAPPRLLGHAHVRARPGAHRRRRRRAQRPAATRAGRRTPSRRQPAERAGQRRLDGPRRAQPQPTACTGALSGVPDMSRRGSSAGSSIG